MSWMRSLVRFSNLINGNISKKRTNRSPGWDQGTWWHLRNQSHFDKALDDTSKGHARRAFLSVLFLKNETSSQIRSEGL